MTILVTGAAGFIGFHLSQKLLDRDETVIGIDNLNDYYDVRLKEARLKLLRDRPGFLFERIDIGDTEAMRELAGRHRQITRIVNLAAQAGVRYSIENPRVYARSNLDGFLEVLELARFLPHCEHLVYASSSSVYGAGGTPPFSTDERCDTPVSLYAATKRANELMAHTYSHLYRLKLTGLRFFTVYGPWGRPDMAPYLFTEAVLKGRKLRVFNNGEMRRDFTYVDDIVAGTIAALDHPPADDRQNPPHRLYNIGNHRSEKLMDFIGEIERACGRKAELSFEPMQPGDVRETFADIEPLRRDLGYEPRISIAEGVPRFVAWYRSYHGI